MGCSWIWRSELGIKDLCFFAEFWFGKRGAGRDPGFVRELLAATKAIWFQMKYEGIYCFPLRC